MTSTAENLERVKERITAAAERAGRDPEGVTLVAVTKTVAPERVEEALAAGQMMFGENKVQEARAKIPVVSGRARWHMVGHLQTNKVRDAVALFEMIHSVDSLKLAAEIDQWAERAGKVMPALIEVNVAGERSKFGLRPDQLPFVLQECGCLRRLEVQGLMTVPPISEKVEDVRPYFRALRELRDRTAAELSLHLPQLSMGMTQDFEIAVEEGATMVRIGTAIFGERRKRGGLEGEAPAEPL